MVRTNYSSGTAWEKPVGYSMAVRIGNTIHVSGTTATDVEGNIVGIDDPCAQAVQCIRNIEKAMKESKIFKKMISDIFEEDSNS